MGVAGRVLHALRAAGIDVSALERKAAAYDAIARAYGLGTSEANVDRCVTVATYARELRDEAMRTRDMAVDAGIALRARVAELETERDHARRALSAWAADLSELSVACGQRDDEYPRQAVERRLAELSLIVEFVRRWLAQHGDAIPVHEYQELASILDDAPRTPERDGAP